MRCLPRRLEAAAIDWKRNNRAGAGFPSYLKRNGDVVKLYRINKVTKPRGTIIKKKHILASSDQEAVKRAADSSDCPICDVLRDGKMVGSVI